MKINKINIDLLQLKSFSKSQKINNNSDDKSDEFFIDLLKKTSDRINQIINEGNPANFINTKKDHSRIFKDSNNNNRKDRKDREIIKLIQTHYSAFHNGIKNKFNPELEQYLEILLFQNKHKNRIFFKTDIGKKTIRLICLIVSHEKNSAILFPLFWDINHNIDSTKGRENKNVKYEWKLNEVAVHNFFKCSLFSSNITIICSKSSKLNNDFNNRNCEEKYLSKEKINTFS